MVVCTFLLVACDPVRSVDTRDDAGAQNNGGVGGGGAPDLAAGRDQGSAAQDQGTAASPDLATASDVTVAAGVFVKGQQSGGDTGSGSASLVRHPNGSEIAVFGADFQSSAVPAGEVVLTSRSSIGVNGIDPATDLDLGPLQSNHGAQSYSLSGSDGGKRNLFVYCVTYGIDVAVAHLQ
jgi:hypothetical protein